MASKKVISIIIMNYLKEFCDQINKILVELEESDEEIELASAYFLIRDQFPNRITNYVERVIPGYCEQVFKMHFRIPHAAFDKLLGIFGPIFNEAFGCSSFSDLEKHLLSVIWLLATPDSYKSVAERFNMAKSSLWVAFVRVVSALNSISSSVIKWPDSNRMVEIKEGFRNMGRMRNVIGAIDGTYIKIDAPCHHPEDYINRKMYHSITLQAICDHTLRFTDCFVGYPSSVHDCRIFRNSDIYRSVVENTATYIPNSEYILGDKAYPSLMWSVVPYKNTGRLSDQQRNFNKFHSKTRQTIERAFALLFGRFRRLKLLQMKRDDFIPKTVLAACVLHNICLDFTEDVTLMEFLPVHGDDREAESMHTVRENSQEALDFRNRICVEL